MSSLWVRQIAVGPMKNFSYLVGAEGAPEVLVVDPAWEVDAIVRAAQEGEKRIVGAFVSHHHGDHINGLPDLLARFDVPIYAQKSEIDFSEALRSYGQAMRGLSPGDVIEIGPLRARALHTPGHTPGSHCLYAHDALVSGDTVFVNACGRCDFQGGDPEAMYRSLKDVLGALPDGTQLFPGHDYGDVKVSSLGREKSHNPYFQFADVASFVTYRMRPRR